MDNDPPKARIHIPIRELLENLLFFTLRPKVTFCLMFASIFVCMTLVDSGAPRTGIAILTISIIFFVCSVVLSLISKGKSMLNEQHGEELLKWQVKKDLVLLYTLPAEGKDILWQFIGEGKEVVSLMPSDVVEDMERNGIIRLEFRTKRGSGPFRYILPNHMRKYLHENPRVLGD